MSDHLIDYEILAKEALRSVVRSVLKKVAKNGLPGEHHFYISFHTTAPGVNVSSRITAQYPKEMTIVLQHQFWDMKVEDDYFEVRLSFSNIPERLVIPFSAIKVFFDPSVPYGLQFDPSPRPEAVEDKSDPNSWHDMPPASSLILQEGDGNSGFIQDRETMPFDTSHILSGDDAEQGQDLVPDDLENESEDDQSDDGDNVISLDRFRNK